MRYLAIALAFFIGPVHAGAISEIGSGVFGAIRESAERAQAREDALELERQKILLHEQSEARRAERQKSADAIEYRAEQQRRLTRDRPDWIEIRESPAFKAWFPAQPKSVRALATSWRAEDAILLIDLFKRDNP